VDAPNKDRISPVEYAAIISFGLEKNMATVMMKEGTRVPVEFLESFRENFELIDDDKDGIITRDQASLLFRGLGQTPTNSELNDMVEHLPQQVTFEDFVHWFGSSYRIPISERDLTRAFRVFDLSNSGVLPVSKFRELLTNLGDHMSSEEIEEIVKEIPVDSRGNFDYVVFARRLAEGPKGCPHLISKEN
jgi:calmodulin